LTRIQEAVMENPTYINMTIGQAGTSSQMTQVVLKRNDVIELLKSLDGLKNKLQMLLK